MFRSLLLSSAALAALSTVSVAADLPSHKMAPAPYVAAPILTWTGFYVGAQVGAAWTTDKFSDYATGGPLLATGKVDASSIVGGLHAGYNMQAGALVYGLEGDLELSGLKKTSAALYSPAGVLFGGAYGYGTKIDWQGSVRGRLGYAMGPALFYATGGVAFANIKTSYNPGGYSTSDVKTGWTVGGGVEYAIAQNWTARAEYRYTDYGSFTDTTAAAPVTFWSGEDLKHKLQEQAVRVGVSYKFGGAATPIAARY